MCLVPGKGTVGSAAAAATAAASHRSGERERGEYRTRPGDWQPGVLSTRDRCSSRMAWGSSSHWPPPPPPLQGRRGCVSPFSSLSSSYGAHAQEHKAEEVRR